VVVNEHGNIKKLIQNSSLNCQKIDITNIIRGSWSETKRGLEVDRFASYCDLHYCFSNLPNIL